MAEDGSVVPVRTPFPPGVVCAAWSAPPGWWGGFVAPSAVAPPGPIPNPVVTHRSAGEYWGTPPREARPPRVPPTTWTTKIQLYQTGAHHFSSSETLARAFAAGHFSLPSF
jgi:hypothetical protein